MPEKTADEWLTTKEVSALIKKPVQTLHYWAHTKQGPAYTRVGRERRYLRVDVDAWLRKQPKGGEGA